MGYVYDFTATLAIHSYAKACIKYSVVNNNNNNNI